MSEPSPNDWASYDGALNIVGGSHGVVNHPSRSAGSPATSHSSGPSRSSQSPKANHPYTLGPQTSYERAREPASQEMEGMSNQIPMQYAESSMSNMHSTGMHPPPFVPSMQPSSNVLFDQNMGSLDPMAYYEYGFSAPPPSRMVQVRNELPDPPPSAASRQHIWKSFIEGLMDDSVP